VHCTDASSGTEAWGRAVHASIADGRQLGVTPSLRRQLSSVAAVQKIAQENDFILSIAAELAFWPAVRNAEAHRGTERHRGSEAQRDTEAQLRLRVNCMGSDATTSEPPEGVPYENG
jgi:hypothetical protein